MRVLVFRVFILGHLPTGASVDTRPGGRRPEGGQLRTRGMLRRLQGGQNPRQQARLSGNDHHGETQEDTR